MNDSSRTAATVVERLAWCAYDVANSAFALVMVTAVLPLYFSAVVAQDVDPGRADALWGYAISGSMALVALTSPFMGALADRRRWRKSLLVTYAVFGVLATASWYFIGPGTVLIGLLLFGLGNFCFEGSLVFYDSLLPGLVARERIGRWSGIGWSLGYLGSLLCLGLALGLIQMDKMAMVFPLVGAWWFLWTLPLATLVRDRVPAAQAPPGGVFKQTLCVFRRIRANRDLSRFFIAFFLFNDGIATTIAFAGLYASKTLGFTSEQTVLLIGSVQVSAAAGAFALGFVADRIGHARTISGTLVVWILLIVAAYLTREASTFWYVAIGVGLVLGATQSASRGFLACVAAEGESGELFGFKAVAGKFSAVLGPLLFGVISEVTGNQRLALLAIGSFFVIGLVLMLGVDEERARLGPVVEDSA